MHQRLGLLLTRRQLFLQPLQPLVRLCLRARDDALGLGLGVRSLRVCV